MIRELDCVSLTSDLPSHGLKRGEIGTVVFVYDRERAFEVEFFGPEGETIALATLNPDQVSRCHPGAVDAASGMGDHQVDERRRAGPSPLDVSIRSES